MIKAIPNRRIKYVIDELSRELIMDVVAFLVIRRGELNRYGYIHDTDLTAAIAELLSYLPEVQADDEEFQFAMINGLQYDFRRTKLKRSLTDALHAAEQFDSNECEVMLLCYRSRLKREGSE